MTAAAPFVARPKSAKFAGIRACPQEGTFGTVTTRTPDVRFRREFVQTRRQLAYGIAFLLLSFYPGRRVHTWTEKAANYRAHKARCLRLAEDKRDVRVRQLYLMAAAQWGTLADTAQRTGQGGTMLPSRAFVQPAIEG